MQIKRIDADVLMKGPDEGSGYDLTGADLSRENLALADLRKAKLRDADLRYADLRSAHLTEADLRGARLQYANLTSATLWAATLLGANLQGVRFAGARLQYADLRYANLTDTRLLDANFRDSDLRGANLTGARDLFPPNILMAAWGVVTDEICIELMRYDAANHPHPEMFVEWSKGGLYPGSYSMRSANFTDKRELYTPGPAKSAYELMTMLLKEYCVYGD